MYTKRFNGYLMVGLTAEDNKTLANYCRNDLDDTLVVDNCGRVFDANECYIADVQDVEPGEGLYCFYDF